jgi:hypothetical protein
MLNFIGFVLLSLRNFVPDFITVILSNTFIVICFVLIARGLLYFAEGEQNILMDISAPFLLIIVFFYFVYLTPDVKVRIVVVSLIIMFISLRCAFITHKKITPVLGGENWLLIITFIFLALWLLLRTALTISIEGDIQNFLSSGSIQGFSFVMSSVGHIFIVVGLIIINAQRLEKNLIKANSEIKILRGFLPICSSCKKIRDDKGYWNQIEEYIHQHSEAEFSHGICPECSNRLYGDQDWYIEMKKKKGNK